MSYNKVWHYTVLTKENGLGQDVSILLPAWCEFLVSTYKSVSGVVWHIAYHVLSPPLADQAEHLRVAEAEQEGDKHTLNTEHSRIMVALAAHICELINPYPTRPTLILN